MANLSIADPEAYRLANELAEITGKTPGEAVIEALRERVEKERAAKQERERVIQRVLAIGKEISLLPVLDSRSPDDMIGYNEVGVPS